MGSRARRRREDRIKRSRATGPALSSLLDLRKERNEQGSFFDNPLNRRPDHKAFRPLKAIPTIPVCIRAKRFPVTKMVARPRSSGGKIVPMYERSLVR